MNPEIIPFNQATANGPTSEIDGICLPSRRIESARIPENFKTEYEGDLTKFDVATDLYEKKTVRLTLKEGINSLWAAFEELSAAIKKTANYPGGFELCRSGNSYPDLPFKDSIVIIYRPVVKDSGNRVRHGLDPENSHQGLLASLNLEFVPNDLHRLACASMRVSKGFPQNRDNIGKGAYLDPSDLNQGYVVRTAKGSNSGLVATYPTGIRTNDWQDLIKHPTLVVAGMSFRNY